MIICDVCKKDITGKTINHAWGMTLCCKHYQQKLKYGHFLDSDPYSIQDSNEFRIEGDVGYIILKTKKGVTVGEAIVDAEDIDRLILKKWRLWKGRVFTGNFKPISLQYEVLNAEKKNDQTVMAIDHINGNPLDNRKCNLRIVTQAENAINKEILSNNTSGFMGICSDKERGLWAAEIRIKKKKCHLGRYKNLCDAVYARYLAEQELFGEYRSTRNDDKILREIENCTDKENIEKYVEHRLHDIYNL